MLKKVCLLRPEDPHLRLLFPMTRPRLVPFLLNLLPLIILQVLLLGGPREMLNGRAKVKMNRGCMYKNEISLEQGNGTLT